MTLQDLASKAGLSLDYVSKLELGSQNPTIETLASIAKALNTTILNLLQNADDVNTEKTKALTDLRMYLEEHSAKEIHYVLELAKTALEKKPK